MQGLLLINKPSGITSFGVCARLRHITGEKRIGHTGTLDPMATGVLPVFIGRATVLSRFLLESDKRYEATVKLGIATDTDDITGNIIKRGTVNTDDSQIIKVLNSFLGESEQLPPNYSAIKKDGVPLYKLARKGITPELKYRKIFIKEINILSGLNENNEFKIDVLCSKGTYIRSLCRDVGEKLGCFAALAALKRTVTGAFSIEQCTDLDTLNSDNITDFIKPEESALNHLRKVFVSDKQAVRFSNGGELSLDRIKAEFNKDGENLKVMFNESFLGVGLVVKSENILKVKCIVTQIKL